MEVPICCILVVLHCLTVTAEMTDQGPQIFKQRTHLSPQQTQQPQQQYKEVIMYLTPTQIKALESGQAVIEPQSTPQPNFSNESQKQKEQDNLVQLQLQQREKYMKQQQIVQQQNAYIQNQQLRNAEKHDSRTHIPIKEPDAEQLQVDQRPELQKDQELLLSQQHPQSFAYIHFYPPGQPQNDIKIQLHYPQPHEEKLNDQLQLRQEKGVEIETDPLLQQKYQLVPYEHLTNDKHSQQLEQKDLYQKLGHSLEQNWNKELFQPAPQTQSFIEDSLNQQNDRLLEFKLHTENELSDLQYAPNYNGHKYATNIEKILKNIQLEKELARNQIEAIEKSPPVVVHKDINIIKRRPIEVVKHVKIPFPAPFLVPVPEPYEVKIPQPYPVPLEIIRHIPIPIVKTEKVEVEKPVPVEIEKQVPVPVEKKVYVKIDKPYTVERFVPVEIKKEIPVEIPIHKPEKLTILRHIWEH